MAQISGFLPVEDGDKSYCPDKDGVRLRWANSYDHPSSVPHHKGVTLKRSYCPSFPVCLHEYYRNVSALLHFPLYYPSFFRLSYPLKLWVSPYQPFPPSFPFPSFFHSQFCPETLFQGALKPVIYCGYRSCFLAYSHWGGHQRVWWPSLGITGATSSHPAKAGNPGFPVSSLGNDRAAVCQAFNPGLERSVQWAHGACLSGRYQAKVFGFWDLSICLPAVLPLCTCLSDPPPPSPTWEPHSFLVRASLLISFQVDRKIFLLNFMLNELVEGPLTAGCKVDCGFLTCLSVLPPHV